MKVLRITAGAAESFGRVFVLYGEPALLVIGIIVVVTAVIAPFFGDNSPLHAMHAQLCHQIEERCFAVDGTPMALCTRCLGGHLAFVLAWGLTAIFAARKRALVRAGIFLATAGLMDVIFHTIGLYDTGNVYRFISGALLGFGIGIPTFVFARSIRKSALNETSSA